MWLTLYLLDDMTIEYSRSKDEEVSGFGLLQDKKKAKKVK